LKGMNSSLYWMVTFTSFGEEDGEEKGEEASPIAG
jgi:hypothetical protein